MRFRVDLAASVAKDCEREELNEDAWAFNETLTCIAVADGASESYDSQRWAKLLVEAYVHDQSVSAAWVADRVQEYVSCADYPALSWARQAAFDRGSFATLLGLELAPNGTDAEVLAIGDSLAVHVRNLAKQNSFPFSQSEQFDARPQLLSTISANNSFVGTSDFFKKNSSSTWAIQPGDIIYLMTDAVGHWLLRECESAGALGILSSIVTKEEFQALVMALRHERRMRLDDSTVIRIAIEDSADV